MFVMTGVTVEVDLLSSAHCCLAPSIWRRLLMQAFIWAVVRARTKLGMAMAANRPMMATTIMISTRVKPVLRKERIFIQFDSFCRGVNESIERVYMITNHRSQIAQCEPQLGLSKPDAIPVGRAEMPQPLQVVCLFLKCHYRMTKIVPNTWTQFPNCPETRQ